MTFAAQRGVALISIMLVVAIATVLAVQMTNEQRLVIQRTANRFDAAQARQYALGGEELARQILRQDFEENPAVDHHGEAWASPAMQFEFENGVVELQIEDLQGKFNLNALYASRSPDGTGEQGQPGANDSGQALATLTRLVASIGADPMYAARIKDWIDADDAKGQLGAEDFDYLGLDPPFRAADQPMAGISELRLILEMDRETFAALSPHVAALPVPGMSININTATAPVLTALVPDLTLESAEGLVNARESSGGYESVSTFLQEPMLAGSGLSAEGLGVQSSFFRISVRARFLERYAYLTSIVQRNPTDGSMRVFYRDMSKKIVPAVARAESGDD